MKKSVVDIDLVYGQSNDEHNANGNWFDNRAESL